MEWIEDLKRINSQEPGSWPMAIKAVVLSGLLVAIMAGGYFLDWQEQSELLDKEKAEEETLKETYLSKKKDAVNLDILRQQLPEVKHYEHFQYAAFDNPDPFVPRKTDVAKSSGANQPDMQRRRETLEGFPLESLKMVGSLNQKEVTYALIRAPDNTVHRIRSGAYLGQNFGVVIDISESEVKLKEIVQDSNADWVERVSTLMLEDQEQNK